MLIFKTCLLVQPTLANSCVPIYMSISLPARRPFSRSWRCIRLWPRSLLPNTGLRKPATEQLLSWRGRPGLCDEAGASTLTHKHCLEPLTQFVHVLTVFHISQCMCPWIVILLGILFIIHVPAAGVLELLSYCSFLSACLVFLAVCLSCLCVFLTVSLSVYLCVFLVCVSFFVCASSLSVCLVCPWLCIYLPIWFLPVSLSQFLSACLPCLSACLVCLPALSVCLPALSVCLPACLVCLPAKDFS